MRLQLRGFILINLTAFPRSIRASESPEIQIRLLQQQVKQLRQRIQELQANNQALTGSVVAAVSA